MSNLLKNIIRLHGTCSILHCKDVFIKYKDRLKDYIPLKFADDCKIFIDVTDDRFEFIIECNNKSYSNLANENDEKNYSNIEQRYVDLICSKKDLFINWIDLIKSHLKYCSSN